MSEHATLATITPDRKAQACQRHGVHVGPYCFHFPEWTQESAAGNPAYKTLLGFSARWHESIMPKPATVAPSA